MAGIILFNIGINNVLAEPITWILFHKDVLTINAMLEIVAHILTVKMMDFIILMIQELENVLKTGTTILTTVLKEMAEIIKAAGLAAKPINRWAAAKAHLEKDQLEN